MTSDHQRLLSFKKNIHDAVALRHQASIETLEATISALQQSANEETKTSMGDKYETGRAMVQLEIEKIMSQLSILRQSKPLIDQASPGILNEVIQRGAVVRTSLGYFYLLYSGGEVDVDGHKIIAISPASPMAKAIHGKRKGDEVSVNGKSVQILEVF
jgi:Transcription elongation factor, GreA/GreB, C-term